MQLGDKRTFTHRTELSSCKFHQAECKLFSRRSPRGVETLHRQQFSIYIRFLPFPNVPHAAQMTLPSLIDWNAKSESLFNNA